MNVIEYCGTNSVETTGKGREIEGKRVLWNQGRGTDKKGKGDCNEYCGNKPAETTGKGRESEGKRVLWNQASGNDRKGKGE